MLEEGRKCTVCKEERELIEQQKWMVIGECQELQERENRERHKRYANKRNVRMNEIKRRGKNEIKESKGNGMWEWVLYSKRNG